MSKKRSFADFQIAFLVGTKHSGDKQFLSLTVSARQTALS
jgi:hypothetical protein